MARAQGCRQIKIGRERKERAERSACCYIMNREIPPECLLERARNCWAIKNGLRRVPGVFMDEDRETAAVNNRYLISLSANEVGKS